MKAKTKRYISLFLAIVFCFSLLGTFPAFAATTVQAYMVNYPRQNDPNYGDSRFGHSANYLMSGWAYVAYERMTLHAIGSYNGQIAYCIEPGVDQDSGDTLTSTDESYWDNYPASSNVTIPPETIKTLLGRVLTYGCHGNISQDWMTGNASGADSLSYAIATQMLVWEVVVGERDANFDHVDPSAYGKGAVMDYIGASNPLRSQIMSYYNQIIENIKTHNVMPSFCAPSRDYARAYELEQDGSEYTLTLTDSNGVLDNYAFSADVPGVSFSKSGNRFTITCDTPTEETILVTAEKQNAYSSSLVIWSDGTWSKAGVQDTITYGENVSDSVNGYFELEMDAAGGLRIVKTSEDGNVSGIEFTITGEGYSERVRTGSDGTIDVTGLMPGRYTVTEINSDAYTPQDSQTVTIAGGESAVVTFDNTLKRGALQVRKSAEDNFIEGVTFHLYGTSASGLEVDEYAVTGADGVAERSFHNVLKKFSVTVTKTDAETGSPRGDATLAGAAYGLYRGGELVDTFYTDDTGTLMLPEELPYGEYELIEVAACHGYILDSTPVPFTVDGSENIVTVVKYNSPQMGVIRVSKTGEVFTSVTESGGLYTPVYEAGRLEGATFTISAAEDILAPDGSVRTAAGTVVDTITTGPDGTASSKELYLGKYVITETSAPNGMVLNTEPQTVELAYAGQDAGLAELEVTFLNERQRVQISLSKSMASDEKFGIGTNGEISAVSFGLYAASDITAADGSVIPADGLIEIAVVNADGTAAFTSDLPLGSYYVQEYATDSRYILSDERYPVEFTYAGQDTPLVSVEVNDGEAIVNELKYGSVSGIKLDENGKALSGALFGLFRSDAVEFTEEGALLTATSGEDGIFVFENLPVGDYIVRELTAPAGYVLDENAYYVEITTDGEVCVVENEAGVGFLNQPLRGALKIVKTTDDGKVEGFAFRVSGVNGYDMTFTTDANGEILIEGLRIGEYVVTELENGASEGYEIAEPVTVTLVANETLTVNVHNKITVDVPKAGDDSLTPWIILIAAGLAGIAGVGAYCYFGVYRKGKGGKRDEKA